MKAPPEEWAKILKLCPVARGGVQVCKFYNSSTGCRFGDACTMKHECLAPVAPVRSIRGLHGTISPPVRFRGVRIEDCRFAID